MNLRLKRARELAGYAVQLTKDEGLPTMLKRGAGFVKRRCFGKRPATCPPKGAGSPARRDGRKNGRHLRPAHHLGADPAV